MKFSIHSLGSGSCGNSMLIQASKTKVLLDAGIGMRHLQKRLSKFKVGVDDLDAVFLTHEHGDHTRSALSLSKRYGIPIIANPATLEAISRKFNLPNTQTMQTGESMSFKDLMMQSFPVSHDAVDPVGYNVHLGKFKVSFLTDTGVANGSTLESVQDSKLLIIESNYDKDKLVNGPYPYFLKARILGDQGHLSNEASADFILKYMERKCGPAMIWLAHLSDTNNTPRLARKYVQRRLSEAGCRNVTLDVALKGTSSLTWRPGSRTVQLDLFE